ncbi:di-heme-cytochrome C peroxidase [Paludisphaera mucosa]|uniref:Di-heme-cytochrome C peroxidase n=1 Tax=Paludisphaera mucosa TaxID=3030827 RepID=A0ABT6FK66_9BACT|nr:di-heme-cytochrome C peroxidase [Paludisphaera mucosa]MDG3007973.1 di-heme-cytochrome C peroxidase [Paludisphaera mucosa]
MDVCGMASVWGRGGVVGLVVALAFPGLLDAADNPRNVDLGPGVAVVKSLEQNWTDEESSWFYDVPQGSRLVPYDWFLHLEQAGSTEPFRDPKHIRALGYIPRKPAAGNPDGLPIGFVKDGPDEDGTPMMGLTCAACHTNQIKIKGTPYLIDGGPSLADVEIFLKELAAALRATADDDAKFGRFAATLLPPGASHDEKDALRAGVRSVAGQREGYNDRNLSASGRARFGPGRVDAFGAIFNEVSATFLGIPENVRPANAPVNYPCLWDAPQHDRVQWNGAAENKVSPLGPVLFGTSDVGAQGRNAGEVLGVFGGVEINSHELLIPRRYASTVDRANLIKIEESLKGLWSPQWPRDVLGDIDATARGLGEAVYAANCAGCHESIDRKSPSRRVVARMSDEGTDPNMIRNFGRMAKTGRLEGRRRTLLGLARFGRTESVGVILKHVVERVILDPTLKPRSIADALARAAKLGNPSDAIDSLNPGYRMTATIELGDRKLFGRFDSLVKDGQALIVDGARFHLMPKDRDVDALGVGDDLMDLRSQDGLHAALARLQGDLAPEPADSPQAADQPGKVVIKNATARIAYKARPLNGVWATAPYLHNGSVPSLAELLKPAAQRVKTFHVGGREFDPEDVGFLDDPSQPLFDTRADGNSNAGHEYGADLTPEERKNLLAFLKSL